MKEHIDEMTKVLVDYTKKNHIMASHAILEDYAEQLYEAGYRKQSENAVEIVRCKECWNCEKVPSILGTVLYCNEWCKDVDEDTFCSFGAKMKGGAE